MNISTLILVLSYFPLSAFAMADQIHQIEQLNQLKQLDETAQKLCRDTEKAWEKEVSFCRENYNQYNEKNIRTYLENVHQQKINAIGIILKVNILRLQTSREHNNQPSHHQDHIHNSIKDIQQDIAHLMDETKKLEAHALALRTNTPQSKL